MVQKTEQINSSNPNSSLFFKEAWYTPGKGLHSATGWLEERLRNFRRKLNKANVAESQQTSLSKVTRIPALPGEIFS